MKRKHRIIPRILITLLGIGLIFMGMSGINTMGKAYCASKHIPEKTLYKITADWIPLTKNPFTAK
jgi:hypothetical protein